MAYITSDITSKVQRRIRDTGYSTSEIRDYLNDTQNDIFNEYRLKFMKTSETYALTVGDSDITAGVGLPDDFVTTIKLIDTTDGQELEIENISEERLDEMYPDHGDSTRWADGQPLYWYDDGETIRLFPAPAAAYTLKLRYWKRPTLLSADSDIPEVPSEFEELLVAGAAYRVLQAKDNYDQAAIYENKYQELLQKLVTRYSTAQTGRITRMAVNRFGGTRATIDSWHRRP